MERIRWGVVGAGVVATTFARDMETKPDHEVVAMSSRDKARTQAAAAHFGVQVYEDYLDMLKSDDIDVVYIASPQTEHLRNVLAALEAGKPVLCEKPFAMNANEAEIMVAAARLRGLFLMEAMKTRFLPHVIELRRLISNGGVGDVRHIWLPMAYAFGREELPRLFDPARGGGAILDLGCYAVSFADLLLGEPDEVTAVSIRGDGVDLQTSAQLSYLSGSHVHIHTSIISQSANRAVISGSLGHVTIDGAWWAPNNFTVDRGAAGSFRYEAPDRGGEGLMPQVSAVGAHLRAGDLESPTMPLDTSVRVMRTLDRIRSASSN